MAPACYTTCVNEYAKALLIFYMNERKCKLGKRRQSRIDSKFDSLDKFKLSIAQEFVISSQYVSAASRQNSINFCKYFGKPAL